MVGKLKLLLACLLCLSLTAAWPNSGKKYPTGVASYSGPGDVVASAAAWYGLRAYNHTKANAGASTTKVVDVRGNTTSTSCTIFLKGDGTGNLDLTTAGAGGVGNQCLLGATQFCTVTNASCTISKIYDQSGANNCGGACDISQATTPTQPGFSFNCIGALPCMVFNSLQFLNNTGWAAARTAQPATVSGVAERTGATSSFNVVLWQRDTGSGDTVALYFSNSANKMMCFAGVSTNATTATDAVFHAAQCIVNNTTGTMFIDGSANTVNTGTAEFGTGEINFGTNGAGSNSQSLNGNATEAGMWPVGFSSGQQSSMNSNQHSYWGF